MPSNPNLQQNEETILKQWHPTLNSTPKPVSFTGMKRKKVWWVDSLGHSWETTVANRLAGKNCPYCANNKILAGFNDLATRNPELAKQWHPTKNLYNSNEIGAHSNIKVWWQDEQNHEWEASPNNRSKGKSCPVCAGKPLPDNATKLLYVHPEVAAQWHPTKNIDKVESVAARSHKKVWWLCEQGHEWEAIVGNRKTNTCPMCFGSQPIEGVTDFATTNPLLAAEWHPTKNLPLTTTKVKGTQCPYCQNSQVLTGFNDLKTVNPELAKQWGTARNILQPHQISSGSGKKAWWVCEYNHTWEATIISRSGSQKRGCPYCSGQKVAKGVTDISSLFPAIANEWNYEKNGAINPSDFTAGSNRKVWWVCKSNHSWAARVADRIGQNTGCPKCLQPSKPEKEVYNFFSSLGARVIANDRTVLKSHEIDIYLPESKIGVEFNGLHWHTEKAGKDRSYHHSKWLKAKQAGVQLIQIWEDDWNRNPELVKKMLAHKLGASAQVKIFARKTKVVALNTVETQKFLATNHIQGFASGTHYIGLVENGDMENLVAVLVLKKEPNNTLNIIRYATAANVVGGFTKLLMYAEKTFTPDKFITFADHAVSDGGLYENNGFVADKELPPDYMYVVGKTRKHKFGYRLKRFRNDPNLQYVESMTERELAELNGLNRIWDAGKTRYVKNVETATKPIL